MAKKKDRNGKQSPASTTVSDLLRVEPGEEVALSSYDTHATPGGPGGKGEAHEEAATLADTLAGLQDKLYAASTQGDQRRVLLVLQGTDTSGKDGTVKHVVGFFNPAGTRIQAFKQPTREELRHPFLWRIRRALPLAGEIGVFNRSHYEDVVAARVRGLVPARDLGRRYGQINRFEQSLTDDGVSLLKIYLHISHEEQRDRLLTRLDDPDKQWKFSESDLDDHALWPEYQEAYELALTRCGTEAAPWHIVPADRKWYRNWAVGRLLLEHLQALDPAYPPAGFDVAPVREKLLATG